MSTDCLFREDSYLEQCDATVIGLTEAGGVVLDHRVLRRFRRPAADRGVLTTATGDAVAIASAGYIDAGKTEIAHLPVVAPGCSSRSASPCARLSIGTCAMPACACTRRCICSPRCCPYPVTGGAVGDSEGRLDFDIPEAGLDKDDITGKLAEMIAAGAEVRARWITDAELAAQPGLVKTMSVKPPMGTGRVRLIEIVAYDLQPCGGTHVRATNEIGAVRVTQIEKKSWQNRRVRIAFA
jgi:misacylated tRNA(Ala) deacylase